MSRITFESKAGEHVLTFNMGWDPALKTGYICLDEDHQPVVGCNSQLDSDSDWFFASTLYAWLIIQASEVSDDLGIAVQEELSSDVAAEAYAVLSGHIASGCRCGRPSPDYECERCTGISNAWVNVVSEGNVPA